MDKIDTCNNYKRWKDVPNNLFGFDSRLPTNRKLKNKEPRPDAKPQALINGKKLFLENDFSLILSEVEWARRGFLIKNKEPSDSYGDWQIFPNQKMEQTEISLKDRGNWHTLKWYKENFGVNPLELNLPFVEMDNPHYKKSPPMKLWEESYVKPYKNQDNINKYILRSMAGKKAFQTRKSNMVKWFEEIKTNNPQLLKITEQLWEIGNEIGDLHFLKEDCRSDDPDSSKNFWESGIEHCDKCIISSRKQDSLRLKRFHLFEDLENICESDKQTIQLARKYCREITDS